MPRNRDQELIAVVGQRVAAARKARGLTQEKLAEAISIQPVTLSRLETGARALGLSTLAKIAETLGVGLGDLIDEHRSLPSPEHSPQEAELLRLFQAVPKKKRSLVLRLTRELSE